jgi:hypothetical protein
MPFLKIILAYIAVTGGPKTYEYCARFVGSYLACPPLVEHELVVCCNGGPLPFETASLFAPIPKVQFFPRRNDPGYDITAYQDVAGHFRCDMEVCCGETIRFHRTGWLKRYVEAWKQHGPGMYGTFSSNLIRPHLNTTGFCVAPTFLKGSPRPQNKEQRYEWEHGRNAFWTKVSALGGATRLVTFDGCYDVPQWRYPKDILWRGTQENCLMFCSHTDRYAGASTETKLKWSKGADRV